MSAGHGFTRGGVGGGALKHVDAEPLAPRQVSIEDAGVGRELAYSRAGSVLLAWSL